MLFRPLISLPHIQVQTHIINNIFIGELTSAIVEVRDNPFMAPRHRQMAFIVSLPIQYLTSKSGILLTVILYSALELPTGSTPIDRGGSGST